MKYDIAADIEIVKTLLNLSESQLAEHLGVARSTVNRITKGETYPNDLFLEKFYSFAFSNPIRAIRLNELAVQFASDEYDKVLFHGSRENITTPIDLSHSRNDIDLGKGFYLGESFSQASSYVFSSSKASVYLFDARTLEKLNTIELSVGMEWMLLVCFYRGRLERFKDSSLIKELLEKIGQADVIIAPIADNNMFETMNQFARGDLTDKQAISALSASNLGKQHVLKTSKACQSIIPVKRLYLCQMERQEIKAKRLENALTSGDKARLAIEKFRRQGHYIEELLK